MWNSVFLFPAAVGVGESLTYAFVNSDIIGQLIVVILFVCSVIGLSASFIKMSELKQEDRDCTAFVGAVRLGNWNFRSSELIRKAVELPCGVSELYYALVKKLKEYGDANPNGNGRYVLLNELEFDDLECVLEQVLTKYENIYKGKMIFMSLLVGGAPLLGLFGTVWGVTMAFSGIAMAGKADFAALAPGIAGALLTTIAGIVVAVPAMIFYNITNGHIRKALANIDNFSQEMMVKLRMEQFNLRRRREGLAGSDDGMIAPDNGNNNFNRRTVGPIGMDGVELGR